MTGLQFYLMSWTGQHVLKDLRMNVFKHLHELSLSYYAENEAGAVMSRITNDIDTLQQAHQLCAGAGAERPAADRLDRHHDAAAAACPTRWSAWR